jgi:uncharacterized Rmd1/YagE family protein
MSDIDAPIEMNISTPSPQRCAAYCTASSYNLKPLFEYFKGSYKTGFFRDAVHIEVGEAEPTTDVRDIFCFSYGVIVFWGFEEKEELEFLKRLKPYEHLGQDPLERELMTFSFGLSHKIEEEEIILPDTELFSRLAVSHGMAQSVKLATFENIIQKTIDNTKNIPEQLAAKGRIPLSKREIRKKMGELFIERSSVNLHSDILDIPEFFWDHSEVEPLYTMIAKHLDLETRIEVLNARLDIVHDLFEMLGNELNHQHSSKLEWIIIWLIMIEVIITIARELG